MDLVRELKSWGRFFDQYPARAPRNDPRPDLARYRNLPASRGSGQMKFLFVYLAAVIQERERGNGRISPVGDSALI